MDGSKLGFIKIIVSDLGRVERFYGDAFGMRRTGCLVPPAIEEVILRGAGGASLVLYKWKDRRPLSAGTLHGPIGFHVADVDIAYENAIRAGAAPLRKPADYGHIRAAFVADPEDHEIEIVAG